MNKKNVLMVIPSYKPLIGGAEIQLEKLFKSIKKSKNFLFVIATRRLKNSISQEKILHFPCYEKNILFGIYLLIYLIRYSKKYSIIHCHTLTAPFYFCGLFSLIFKKVLLVKVTRYGSGSQLQKIKNSFFKNLLFTILKKKIFFIALNNKVKFELIKENISKNNIFVVPNGINLKDNKKILKQKKIINILFIGRLIERKKVQWLLDFLVYIKKNNLSIFNKIKINIVGNGPLEFFLKNYAEKHQLSSKVVFHGEIINSSDKDAIFKKSDIFVLPSKSEGMSNSLLEAMSFKLCCLVSNISANSELITNQVSGELFSTKKSFFNCLIKVIENNKLIKNYGENAFLEVKKSYNIKSIAKKYLEIYKLLQDQHG